MQKVIGWFVVCLLCWTATRGVAYAQGMEGSQTTVVTEARWVTDGLILKLATGQTVRVTDKVKAKEMTWTPYETEIILQTPPIFDGWSVIHMTYLKAHLHDKDTAKKALFNVVFLGKG